MVVLVGLSSFVIGTQYKCELYKLLIVECAFVTFVLQIKKRLKTFCKVDEKWSPTTPFHERLSGSKTKQSHVT